MTRPVLCRAFRRRNVAHGASGERTIELTDFFPLAGPARIVLSGVPWRAVAAER
jgi:hypothetical protein